MKVDDDHLYHGAALIQIAEESRFTAINSLQLRGRVSRSAYRINDDIGIYLKYSNRPTPSHHEYAFTFAAQQLRELAHIDQAMNRTYLALVCVKDRQICCLPYSSLMSMVEARKAAKGSTEDQYVVLATLPEGGKFRVYVNQPSRRNAVLGNRILISRSAFPGSLFD